MSDIVAKEYKTSLVIVAYVTDSNIIIIIQMFAIANDFFLKKMKNTETIDELNKYLCLFIKDKFFNPFKINGKPSSLNKYAQACKLSSSTISKINEGEGYNIPVSTIYIILKFENITLSNFFNEFSTLYRIKV